MKAKKIDIAICQLDTAIKLFLDEKDFIPSITLAGAADAILGSIVKCSGSISAYTEISENLSKEYGIPIKELNDKYLNFARNSLKHASSIEGDSIELDPENEALQMIIRAITNLVKYDNSHSSETPRFFDWLSTNRRDLFRHT